jgi:hypothetical protein
VIDAGRRLILTLFFCAVLLLIGVALWPACWLLTHYAVWAITPTRWVLLILGAIVLFNFFYLVALLALRLVIPLPKEGLFTMRPDG